MQPLSRCEAQEHWNVYAFSRLGLTYRCEIEFIYKSMFVLSQLYSLYKHPCTLSPIDSLLASQSFLSVSPCNLNPRCSKASPVGGLIAYGSLNSWIPQESGK
uniref:Uncharacterized protein n=1 Tax=Opuntia streptacantha TaxID=393608 RepID=A0A7C9ER81_OPUST